MGSLVEDKTYFSIISAAAISGQALSAKQQRVAAGRTRTREYL